MPSVSVPSTVSFSNDKSMANHYKAFINYVNQQCKLHSDKVFARYAENGEFKTLTYAQIDHISTNLACKLSLAAKNTKVVSFMSDHTVRYLIVLLAMLKLRVIIMAISPRNSEAATANLLEKTECKFLVANNKYEAVAKGAAAELSGVKVVLLDAFNIEELLQEPLNSDSDTLLDLSFSDQDIEKSALIIHSSGSTAFPKPIYISNRYLFNMLNWFHVLKDSEIFNIDETDCFLSCVPLFHIFGFFAIFSIVTVGGSCVILEKLPPSQQEIDDAFKVCKCTAMFAPPLIYEQMILYLKEKNDFTNIEHLRVGFFAGAPLKYEAGEWLHAHGVNVRNIFGTTEIGPTLSSDLCKASKNWNSLAPDQKDPSGAYYAVFETNDEREPDVKHLYIRGDSPALANGVSNRPDGGFDTNDLFREDPNFPGYYNYIGRRDDTLIMENGEKTNPLPMEATIRQHPMVKQAAVFGQDRQCTACLVEVDMDYAVRFGPEDIIAGVHVAVKEANKECPNHSTILPQMVKILPFNQTLPSTDKGTVMRKKAALNYKDLLDTMYKDFLEGPSRDASKKKMDTSTWSAEDTEDFLITCAAEVLDVPKSTFKDRSQSIFDHGFNSLNSIQLRNHIAEYFDNVPQNFLFQYTSITAMSEALMSSKMDDAATLIEKRYQQTQELAKRYILKAKQDFNVARNLYNDKRAKVVLLTGVTGSLGSFMLHDLLLDKTVKKVYCCVRGKDDQLMDRLTEAFTSRSLDASLLKTDRVEVLPMRFSDPFLGFSESKYDQLKEEVTLVQHCAWLLDFNMPIDHYDKECIAPFYNLLKFAYHEVNPMHVHFISSISASAAYGEEVPEEPLPFDSHTCMPMGYAHSKFVVEILFDYLTTEKNFPCYIERLGQVCGDSIHGVWNTSEQYPLMFVGGGSLMHKMPAFDTVIDWITVDYAAATIVDIMLKTAYLPANRDASVYHIVNPHLIQWGDILESMKGAGMTFDIVPPNKWVSSLEKDETNPAYKLVGFYQDNFKESIKMPVWKTEKTQALAPIIAKTPVLDANLFSKFLKRWQNVGFYNPSA